MKIRSKVIVVVAALFALLITIEILIEERVFLPSFTALERTLAQTSLVRIGFALERAEEGLQLNDQEWSNWAELYQYMQDFNPAFIATYTTEAATAPLKVNLLLLVDREGKYVFSAARDLSKGEPIDLDFASLGRLPDDFPWRANLASGTPAHGLLRCNRGILMLATAPIMNGTARGPTRGMTIMGRLLTNAELAAIGTQAQAPVLRLAPDAAPPGGSVVATANTMQAFQTFSDLSGRPLMTLRTEIPRNLAARGERALRYSAWYLVTAAVLVLVLMLLILNRVVLAPIARMTRHALAIGHGGDLSARLQPHGRDEIAQLGREFDRMVQRVAEARQQHQEQAFQAGSAELAKGVLHDLGNAMTPLQVRLSLLAARIAGLPLADVQWAIGELGSASGDPERRNDLLELIRLGCREIGTALKGGQTDIAAMQAQMTAMRAALSENLFRQGRQAPIEPVSLPSVISQALEIVPKASKRRLTIELDDSLQKLGTVPVARTALRLILQNLVINAAEAVSEAGRDQGLLQFSAQIVEQDGTERLLLRCTDNGIGIAAENLQRIFAMHDGIGLNWCAAAIRSLGGRIWATSEGLGHGASMHIELPIQRKREIGTEAGEAQA
jgi:sensor domain CHASE-containing protein